MQTPKDTKDEFEDDQQAAAAEIRLIEDQIQKTNSQWEKDSKNMVDMLGEGGKFEQEVEMAESLEQLAEVKKRVEKERKR